MELIGKSDAPVINAEAIAKGDLIRAKYSAWSEEIGRASCRERVFRAV